MYVFTSLRLSFFLSYLASELVIMLIKMLC